MKHLIFFFFILGQLLYAQENPEHTRFIDHLFIEGNTGVERVKYQDYYHANSEYLFDDGWWIPAEFGLVYRNHIALLALHGNILFFGDARIKIGVNFIPSSKHSFFGVSYSFGYIYANDMMLKSGMLYSHSGGFEYYFKGLHIESGLCVYLNETNYTSKKGMYSTYFKIGYSFRLGILKKK